MGISYPPPDFAFVNWIRQRPEGGEGQKGNAVWGVYCRRDMFTGIIADRIRWKEYVVLLSWPQVHSHLIEITNVTISLCKFKK